MWLCWTSALRYTFGRTAVRTLSAQVSVKNVFQSLFQTLLAPLACTLGLRPRLALPACAPVNTMLVCRSNVSRAASVGCSSFTPVSGVIARRENVGEVELLSRKWKEEALSLDEISRGLANDTITRRRALAVLGATVVGALIPFARVEAQPGCRKRGHPCTGEGNRCCRNLECRRGVCRRDD